MLRRLLSTRAQGKRFLSTNFKTIVVLEQDGVREIQLNNLKARNSLSLETMNELIEGITHQQDSTSLRAIVISSTGNVFSSGHNLKELVSACSNSSRCINLRVI